VLLTKHASALPSTGVLGVRGTRGHPGTRPAMCGAGAERDVVSAQPGFQHRPHSSTNGLVRQGKQNATKEEKMTEKQESVFTLPSRLALTAMVRPGVVKQRAKTGGANAGSQYRHATGGEVAGDGSDGY
jgi:hypothetical protein